MEQANKDIEVLKIVIKSLQKDLKEKDRKLKIAIEGLRVVISQGDVLGVCSKTLEEIMKSNSEDLPQDGFEAEE